MRRWSTCACLLIAGLQLGAQSEDPAEELLERITARMRENLTRAPDYVCLQTIERSRRNAPGEPLSPRDTLRIEVAFVGNKEVFAWQGSSRFEEKTLADLIGTGVVGTGSFAVHAANVFLTGAPDFTYKGAEAIDGQRAIRFDYEVSRELSRYRVQIPPHSAIVGFRGSFWVDAESLDLMRLEVHAEEIPEGLPVARVSDIMEYERVQIGRSDYLLPHSSEFTMVDTHGVENRNLRVLTACRQYVGEASLSFSGASAEPSPPAPRAGSIEIPPRLPVELSLASEIDLEKAAVGEAIHATLVRPVTSDGRILAPQGASVLGRIVRLESYSTPIEHYVIGLQFDTLDLDGRAIQFSATMEHVESAGGLIRQAKRLDPTFTRRRAPRLEILVNERQEGQGVLHWQARQPRIRAGLRMRWRTGP